MPQHIPRSGVGEWWTGGVTADAELRRISGARRGRPQGRRCRVLLTLPHCHRCPRAETNSACTHAAHPELIEVRRQPRIMEGGKEPRARSHRDVCPKSNHRRQSQLAGVRSYHQTEVCEAADCILLLPISAAEIRFNFSMAADTHNSSKARFTGAPNF